MEAKREQALVGLFVLIASGVLLATIFALSGAFGRAGSAYRAYFRFAAGLEPGAPVRFGGVRVGRVEQLRIDPQDSTRVEMTLSVAPQTPIKKDSVAKIYSLGFLGENYLEITTGTAGATLLPPGSVLSSVEFVSAADITARLNELGPEAQKLLQNLNSRVEQLRATLARVNDLLNDTNRAQVAASLSHVRGMLEENRPKLKATMTHAEASSAKLPALLDDFKKTVQQAQEALAHIDSLVGENREDLRASVAELRQTLASASQLTDQLYRTTNYNAENIDELIDNMRATTENLRQFTETIKTRPYTLIRATGMPDRKPGEPPKQ